MSLILRRVARQGAWTGKQRDIDRALKDFVLRPADDDGLSVYEVTDDEERALVLAALACLDLKDQAIDYIEVAREEVERWGPITDTTANTPVPAANALHRSLPWTQEQLHEMARALFDIEVVAMRFSREQVRTAVGKLEPNEVEGEDVRDFVRRMRERSA